MPDYCIDEALHEALKAADGETAIKIRPGKIDFAEIEKPSNISLRDVSEREEEPGLTDSVSLIYIFQGKVVMGIF